jgi:hypothetical protein
MLTFWLINLKYYFNGEGITSENNSKDNTTLLISYLGYVNQQMTVSELKIKDFTNWDFELNDVAVSNKPNPTRLWPMWRLIASNYKSDGAPSKTYYL